MRKKSVIILLIVATMMSQLVACDGNLVGKYGSEDVSVDVETGTNINEQKQPETGEVTDLSANVDDAVSIDYEIKSYLPVQEFGFTLFKENMDVLNPVMSPVSAYIALTMAGDGAQGNTHQEFLNVLSPDENMTALSESMMNILPKKTDYLEVSLSNSAWVDDEFTVNDEWAGQIDSFYDAEVYQMDVASEKAMKAMNNWISDSTHELIKEMIAQPFDAETRMVLFNALYFNGKWSSPFMENMTNEESFYMSSDEAVKVPMMSQYQEYYEYFNDNNVEGVVLPYRDGNYSFVGIMPSDKNADIREVYNTLTPQMLTELFEKRKSTFINLKLPKFEVEFDKLLNDSLINMGLKDAFDEDKADFSKMGTTLTGNPLYISIVRQKAVVKVDEEGTEAAAVTEIAMCETAALIEDEPIDVFFDRPFIYFIMDMENQIPLFIGIMENPNEAVN